MARLLLSFASGFFKARANKVIDLDFPPLTSRESPRSLADAIYEHEWEMSS